VALQNYRVSSYNKFLSNMHPVESNLWKETKRLLNQEINIIPPLRTDSNLVITDIDNCNVFSDILYLTFSHNHLGNLNNVSKVKFALEQPDYSVQKCIGYVTPNEVKKIIKNLPNKKAPGHDKITNLVSIGLKNYLQKDSSCYLPYLIHYYVLVISLLNGKLLR